MEIDKIELAQTYGTKSDSVLLDMHAAGTLTEMAYEILEAELAGRGVEIPKRPEIPAAHKTNSVDKPSRWRILLHLWCGICLKIFVDATGLSKIFLELSANDPASASVYSISNGLLVVAIVALGYLLSRSIVNEIDSASFSNKAKITAKAILPFAYFAAAVLLSMLYGQSSG